MHQETRRSPRPTSGSQVDYDVAIIGAGFAGIGMAHKLRLAGINNLVILERGSGVGGTWRDNVYPGCACDIPSHLYSFSFRQNPDWTRLYPAQAEIVRYLEDCVTDFGLAEDLRLDTAVTCAAFDEGAGNWLVTLSTGSTLRARVLVSAIGGLSRPSIPAIVGLTDFEGKVFHTASWDADCDLNDKRVAVVGTGASAVQLVPQIAGRVRELVVYQRTPPWVVPKNDRPMRPVERWLLKHLGFSRRLFRAYLYWRQELLGLGFTLSSRLMALGRHQASRHIRGSITDADLRDKVTPDYPMGCKRVLLSDDYYPALSRTNVQLVDRGVERFTRRGIVDSSGKACEADVVIFATGFDAADPLSPARIVGRGGRELAVDWKDGPEAYLGISVAGYPNFFLLMGPNTGLGHNSVIFMIESQIRYAVRLVREILDNPGRTLEVVPEVQSVFNRKLEASFADSVWVSGCTSWYQTESGRQFAIWPGFTFTYWFRTLRPRLRDFAPSPRQSP